MNIKWVALWTAVLGVALAGCGGGGDSSSNDPTGTNQNTGGNSNTNAPASLSGKTYSFTVTSRQGLAEPVGSTYTIAFDDNNYTYNPSPQNTERTTPFTAPYNYDPNTATAILTGTEDVTATFTFQTPTSGTYHFQEKDGEMKDGTFMQL